METFNVAYLFVPILGFFAFLLRRLFVKIDHAMTEREIRMLVKDQIAPMYIQVRGTEEDIARIERKLDKILDLIINDRRK